MTITELLPLLLQIILVLHHHLQQENLIIIIILTIKIAIASKQHTRIHLLNSTNNIDDLLLLLHQQSQN